MDKRAIVLVGGGGHCKSVIEAAESAHIKIHGILDSCLTKGTDVLGYSILGDDKLIPSLVDEFDFVVTIGQIKSVQIREKLHWEIKKAGGRLATIVASSALVSKHATIGAGSVVLHHALVNACASLGEGCIVNSFANIEHDVEIGQFCHISTGVMINGDCKVLPRTFIGSQSVVKNGVVIGENCVIAAGSLVLKDIMESGLYSGVPVVFKGSVK